MIVFFVFNDTAPTEIYTSLHTLSLHDALPILLAIVVGQLASMLNLPPPSRASFAPTVLPLGSAFTWGLAASRGLPGNLFFPIGADTYPAIGRFLTFFFHPRAGRAAHRSEEHTSELQSLMRISYAVFCLKKKNTKHK